MPKLRLSGYDVVAAAGAFWFYVPSMIIFFVLLTEIVLEKEKSLRVGMKMMGLSDSVYWVSWFAYAFIFSILSTLVLMASGSAFQFEFFLNSTPVATFLLFFMFSNSVTTMAFFLTTLIQSSATAQTLGYSIVLIGFVFQVILASGCKLLSSILSDNHSSRSPKTCFFEMIDGTVIDLLYVQDGAWWVLMIRWIFTFYPPYNMAHLYSSIAQHSSNTLDIPSGTVVRGSGFTLSDLTSTPHKDDFFGLVFELEPPIYSLYFFAMNTIFFALLAWYFDNVLAGENGTARSPWFFLTREYWGFHKRLSPEEIESKKVAHFKKAELNVLNNESVDSDVEEEERSLATDEQDDSSYLQVHNLSKTFRSSIFSKDGFKAVDGISFKASRGEIFALLGHNGGISLILLISINLIYNFLIAGKTTTISMLTGLFNSSGGHCLVAGYDIDRNIEEVRSRIGVCPQVCSISSTPVLVQHPHFCISPHFLIDSFKHDILWNELTAKEHLQMFGSIKGLPANEIERQAEEKLKQMGLSKVKDHQVSTFSGGMKRRLSVAVAAIGDPQVLFLDEPTTGMDPVNKRNVWTMIQEMKQNRSILLTTHSMEEADVLGDKVSIMAFGKLRCIGTGLHLKNKFGVGYRLSIVSKEQHTSEVIQSIKRQLEAVILSSNDAGNLTFTIPRDYTNQMGNLLYLCEKLHHKGQISEFGVSHTTLEDVFISVSKKHDFGYLQPDEENLLGFSLSKPLGDMSVSQKDSEEVLVPVVLPTSHSWKA